MKHLKSIFFIFIMINMTSCNPFNGDSELLFFKELSVQINDKGTTSSLTESNTIEWKAEGIETSEVERYEVSLGSQPGIADVVDWTDVGTSNSYQFNKSLNPSTKYYVNIRIIKSGSLNTSEIFSSTGFTTPANTVKQIDAKGHTTCALSLKGDLKCWGHNNVGQLGYDDTVNRGGSAGSIASLQNVNLGVGRTAKQISVGSGFVCALLDNNQIKCWGQNNVGQLGYDDTVNRGGSPGSMASLSYVNLGVGRTAKKVAAGAYSACAILDNNQIKCWGQNNVGQLGYDDMINRGDSAGSMSALGYVNLGSGRTALDVSSYGYTCASLDNGKLKCWGRNDYGQLGQDNTINYGSQANHMSSLQTINLGVGRTVLNFSQGIGHNCVALDNGDVKCWGYNGVGAAGSDNLFLIGTSAGDMAALQKVDLGLNFRAKKVSVGSNHSCALSVDGKIKCWGYNGYGQLGYNNTTQVGYYGSPVSSTIEVHLGLGRVAKDLAVGYAHTCAILDNDDIKCWGLNNVGQLGTDDLSYRGNTAGSMEALVKINYTP